MYQINYYNIAFSRFIEPEKTYYCLGNCNKASQWA